MYAASNIKETFTIAEIASQHYTDWIGQPLEEIYNNYIAKYDNDKQAHNQAGINIEKLY
jgi:hypothetical protein